MRLLAVDPGLQTGVTLGWYDDTTPYQLLERWQIGGGLTGFIDWVRKNGWPQLVDKIVVEKFVARRNDFVADIAGVPIEGVIAWLAREHGQEVHWQTRTDKGRLTPYPKEANTLTRRQRVRFDFLKRFGLFAPGTQNDDSNDCITHSLVYLKRTRHEPTLRHYFS
ncbi:hypothetical protein [Microbacterium sp. No. 7]|uniref:hypothetical protein n=1 Tax=Microbacterium sp. No. 7 TaxID=1714373 RepID=UPI0006D2395F|nr:hypothetical protein [Microbacterium sp. No. 7]ALJ19569.1 hypothetical protein AOA12_06460 [Microbacterium sp. No. 7]